MMVLPHGLELNLNREIDMLESAIEKKLTRWCKSVGILTYKFNSQSMRGVPDRIYMKDGNILFLELKQVGKKPTKLQFHHLKQISDQGINADWAAGYEEAKGKIIEYLMLDEI